MANCAKCGKDCCTCNGCKLVEGQCPTCYEKTKQEEAAKAKDKK
jgi:hypothetical protein